MTQPDPTLSGSSLLPLLRRILQEYSRRVRRWGIPLPVVSVLMEIARNPDAAEPALLAEALLTPRQTMTTLLDALEHRSLARRVPHSVDRRRKILRLTPRGKTLADDISNDVLRFEANAMKYAAPKNLPHLRTSITRYIDALTAQNDAMHN